MCAILDNNVVHEVFGSNRPPAGVKFFNWINSGPGHLVVGGKLLEELSKNHNFRKWLQQAFSSGRASNPGDERVEDVINDLIKAASCESNDHHVIALAQLSNARLLYSGDGDLQQDFKNKELIDNPRGKVYSAPTHERLLSMKGLCRKTSR